MKIKNHTQTVIIPVQVLLPDLNQLGPEFMAKLNAYRNDKTEELRNELLKATPDSLNNELVKFRCNTPIDTIDVTLTLSNFFYDVYISNVVAPTAPLAKKIFEKRLLDLAEKLKDPEEFEVDDNFLNVIKDVMSDDKKWEYSKLHVEVGVNQTTTQLLSRAVYMFPEVLEASVKIFMELESAS